MIVAYILIAFVVISILVIIGKSSIDSEETGNKKLIELGYSIDSKINTGKYIAGHPDINDSISDTSILDKAENIEIMIDIHTDFPRSKGIIEKNSISNILVEDQSTIEKRVSVGRLLLVGIFAFALRKKQKNELAYLTILWNDGRFDHETIFEFEGEGSMQRANVARNELIRLVR